MARKSGRETKISRTANIILILLFLFICVLFAWGERITLSNTINDQKVTNLLIIFGLFFGYFTILEMRVSRISLTLPDIVIHDFMIYAEETLDKKTQKVNAISFYSTPKVRRDIHTDPPNIIIENVGLGVARDIQFNWEYDFEEVKSFVEKIYPDLIRNLNDIDPVIKMDFLPSAEKCNLRPPYCYLYCCGPKLNPWGFNATHPNDTIKPSLRLVISYRDIHKVKYRLEFEVDVRGYDDIVSLSFSRV